MTIVEDKIRVEGNSLIIRMQPAIGLLALTSFVSTESGVTSTSYFDKYFRYSLNGVTFSDWQPLTTQSITGLSVSQTDTLVIELNYSKVDTVEGESLLNVEGVEIEATKSATIAQNYFDKTVFKQYFESDDIEILNWYVNVLEKLYDKGIIPNYIERLNDEDSPDDFIDFWKSIAKFFSYFVIYARTFQRFYEDKSLISEYIEERGLRTSIENSLQELNLLMNKFYSQVAERGTNNIVNQVSQGDLIDGELLRLVWYKPQDEFVFVTHQDEHFGWNLGKSSPLYRGLYLNDSANKFGDKSFEPYDISKYSGATLVVDENKTVLQVDSGETLSSESIMKVSSELDYEFSFLIKKEEGATLAVEAIAYDKDQNEVSLFSHKDGSITNSFLIDATLNRADKYLLVRVVFYNKTKKLFSGDTTSINQGQNLVLSESVVWINPTITIDGGSAKIYGVRLMPLSTPYSHGLTQIKNWISCWIENNNNSLSLARIEEFTRRYLIPYNSKIKTIELANATFSGVEEESDTFSWIGSGQYCERFIWIGEESTAYCEQEEITGPYTLGQEAEGGKIVYILQPSDADYDPLIQKGIVMALSNLGEKVWSIDDQNNIITDGLLMDGEGDTNMVVAALGEGDYAAKACSDLALNGYNDWILPSITDLQYMDRGLFSLGYVYWSSSQSRTLQGPEPLNAFCCYSTFNGFAQSKTALAIVWPVRYFSFNL